MITHESLTAVNTMGQPDNVAPRPKVGAVAEDGQLTASLPPLSWQMIRVTA